ncbi:hypothetical protein [Plebeiibacterium sediminum]|uniref:Trypsin-like peptidase domain-containing protein n=1 Tax=Plebeiibacterium sediminum TaxID=2992112 RepID=A0AAE3M9H6_9BACT|nr:hypothetical protein [Plebeiobacterium sediminum]MCW3789548.1 hypothetical protein [Plebeiobacterium sediminum]
MDDTINEEASKKLQEIINYASTPLLISEKNKSADLRDKGTCTFLQNDNNIYIITALHVIKYPDCNCMIHIDISLIKGIKNAFFQLEEFVVAETQDFAFLKVTEPQTKNYIINRFYRSDLLKVTIPTEDYWYYFRGFSQYKFNEKTNTHYYQEHISKLTYLTTIGKYYYFQNHEIITNDIPYRGCSGTGVYSERSELVGIITDIVLNTKYVIVLPILTIKESIIRN